MVTEQYSHVLVDGQQSNADLIEKYFYGKVPLPERQGKENAAGADAGSAMSMLLKLIADPETAAVLKTLLGNN